MTNEWAALQFDNAVTFVGLTIENAEQELHEVGGKWENKYTMRQLLDPAFALSAGEEMDAASLRGVEGVMFDEVS